MSSTAIFDFPLGTVIGTGTAAHTAHSKNLGKEVGDLNGNRYRLVKATGAHTAAAAASHNFKYTSKAATTVELAGASDAPCGMAVASQEAIAAGDLFWLQFDGRVSITDNGSGLAAGALVESAASGETVLDGAYNATPYITFGRVVDTIAADAVGEVDLFFPLRA